MKEYKVKPSTFNAIIAHLMWLSRTTLDKDRLLNDAEYLETARLILDRLHECGLAFDYVKAEEVWIKQRA